MVVIGMSDQDVPARSGAVKLEIYTRKFCGFCVRAKMLLDEKGVKYVEHSIDGDSDKRNEMIQRALGRYTVPQIFIDDQPVGGCTELFMLERSGELDAFLSRPED